MLRSMYLWIKFDKFSYDSHFILNKSSYVLKIDILTAFFLFCVSRLDLEVDSELTRFLELHDSVLVEASDLTAEDEDPGQMIIHFMLFYQVISQCLSRQAYMLKLPR